MSELWVARNEHSVKAAEALYCLDLCDCLAFAEPCSEDLKVLLPTSVIPSCGLTVVQVWVVSEWIFSVQPRVSPVQVSSGLGMGTGASAGSCFVLLCSVPGGWCSASPHGLNISSMFQQPCFSMGSVSSRWFAACPDVEAGSWCLEGFGKARLGGDELGSVLGRQVAAHSQQRANLGSQPWLCFTAVQAARPFLFHCLLRAQEFIKVRIYKP